MRRFMVGLVYGGGFGIGLGVVAFSFQWLLPWDKQEVHYLHNDAYIKVKSFNSANVGIKFAVSGEIENVSNEYWHGVTLEAYLSKDGKPVDECIGTAYSVGPNEVTPFHIRCENTFSGDAVDISEVKVRWLLTKPYENFYGSKL